MRFLAVLFSVALPLPLLADPLECLDEGSIEKIAENIPAGSIVYRDCYHCRQPAYEVIEVTKTELRPCHMHGSAGERALYITGKVKRRFKMEKCGQIDEDEQVQEKIADELLVLNYAWLYNAKTGEATNIADMFGENSHHLCRQFTDRKHRVKAERAKKSGG
ncbi:MAG: hypothetical protein OHK0011_24850 [Turneriella sp.]